MVSDATVGDAMVHAVAASPVDGQRAARALVAAERYAEFGGDGELEVDRLEPIDGREIHQRARRSELRFDDGHVHVVIDGCRWDLQIGGDAAGDTLLAEQHEGAAAG